MGSSCEKYIRNIQITTQAIPFSNSFSPAVGGSQKLTKVNETITNAGVTTIALNIGEWRWKTKLNARLRMRKFKSITARCERCFRSHNNKGGLCTYVNVWLDAAWIEFHGSQMRRIQYVPFSVSLVVGDLFVRSGKQKQ